MNESKKISSQQELRRLTLLMQRFRIARKKYMRTLLLKILNRLI